MNSLSDSLQYLKGVGPKKVKLFRRLGISSVEDLLYHFPRRYEDRSNLVSVSKVEIGKVYTIKGKILTKQDRNSWRRRGFSIVELSVGDKTSRIFAVWFNQPYLKQYFKLDQELILYGKVELYKDRLQMSNPEFEILEEGEDSLSIGRIVPIYSVCEGITQRFMRSTIKNIIDNYISKITDSIPYDIRKRHNLMNLAKSLINIHFPETDILNEEAYQRLSFEEFFLFQIPIALRKLKKKHEKGIAHKTGGRIFSELSGNLPFELTDAQKRVLQEIKTDMSGNYPMQRLLQGEVGSGKTIVALLASAIALDGGYQVAFMAPTEILAKQHFDKISSQLSEVRSQDKEIRISLLASSLSKKEKKGIYQGIKSGKIDLVIGTHALLQEELEFNKLGLAIIDEQHRFGVAQRGMLPKKGLNPDILIMTATPIPRTLSMTLYGDLDVSIIDELPKERLPIKTFHYSEERLDEVYEFVRGVAKQQKQVYFVCPVIEESQEEDLEAAETIYKELKENIYKEFNIGLIHGRLDSKSADKIMQDFRNVDIHILVATSVLEVGIDIPNATCMVVLQAERFGLAQLHQLRGRIGRGKEESYFIIVSDPKTEEAKARIKAITDLLDGFQIAEEDLRNRGPGEFFGKRQHGLTALKIANPLTQMRLLKNARDEAIALLAKDPILSMRQNQQILLKIKKNFPEFPKLDIIA